MRAISVMVHEGGPSTPLSRRRSIVKKVYAAKTCIHKHLERCFLIETFLFGADSANASFRHAIVMRQPPGPVAIKYVIAFFGWAIVAAVPFVLALRTSRKRILAGRWIIIRIVTIFDIVGFFGLFDRQVTWSEELGTLAEAISPTIGLIFLDRPDAKFWLSMKNDA